MEHLIKLKNELETKKGAVLSMIIGLDGFVDEIIHMVDKRQDLDNFTRINTISELGERISRAAGLSTNIEMVTVQTKLGGNGPIFSNALLEYGVKLTYVGALGNPDIHPVFKPMAEKSEKVYSICDPAHTDALEFNDGKLLFGKMAVLGQLTWDTFKASLGGPEKIAEMIAGCDLFGMENWTMVPKMSEIWEGIIDEVFPLIKTGAKKPFAFFDLADPEKRSKEDLKHAMKLVGRFDEKFNAILGLNEKELYQVAEVLGVAADENINDDEKLKKTTVETYEKLGIHCLAVHPTRAAVCCQGGEFYRTEGPYCENPILTTGAGDNFNAGFCFGKALGLEPLSALTLGVSTSGYYVRNAKSPAFDDAVEFVGKWNEGKID